jgi:hypothetical protein
MYSVYNNKNPYINKTVINDINSNIFNGMINSNNKNYYPTNYCYMFPKYNSSQIPIFFNNQEYHPINKQNMINFIYPVHSMTL